MKLLSKVFIPFLGNRKIIILSVFLRFTMGQSQLLQAALDAAEEELKNLIALQKSLEEFRGKVKTAIQSGKQIEMHPRDVATAEEHDYGDYKVDPTPDQVIQVLTTEILALFKLTKGIENLQRIEEGDLVLYLAEVRKKKGGMWKKTIRRVRKERVISETELHETLIVEEMLIRLSETIKADLKKWGMIDQTKTIGVIDRILGVIKDEKTFTRIDRNKLAKIVGSSS